jgi:hypothetical protein
MSPVLIFAIAAGIPLFALCIGTAWLVLRAAGRAHVRRWSGTQLLCAVVAACVPWIAVRFWRWDVNVSVHSILPLLGWALLAVCVFALLVLLPLAVLLAAIVWVHDRRMRATRA